MIIILEGPDGSGKTTLAEKIAKQTNYPIIHRTKPNTEEEKAAMMLEYQAVVRSGRNMIFDRCWYSEMAYGPTMRDDSVISYPQMFMLESDIATHGGGLIIYCTDKPEVLWKRCQQRGEDYIVHKADFMDICEAFDEIMQTPHLLPVVRYAYKDV